MFMSGSVRRRLLRPAMVIAVAGSFLVMATLPAGATIKGPQSTTVSCNASIFKTGVTVTQAHTANFGIRQNSSSPVSTTVVWAVNSAGNSLPTKQVSNGQTATWTSVLPGRYTVHAHRLHSMNCNGIGFGDGNYNWDYTVIYTD